MRYESGPLFIILIGVSFNNYIHLFTLFQFVFSSPLIRHDIFNSNFLIQIVGFENYDLGLFRFRWDRRLDELFDRPS